MLEVGTPAPAFELPNQDGEPIALSEFRGQRVVLYFYPRANTDGCTTEACGFRDNWQAYRDRDITVLGVSDDPVSDLADFGETYDLPFHLLSDADGTVSKQYDSFGEKQMFGNTFEGVYRNTYVIDADGMIERAYEGVDPEGHAETILADLSE
ncbi:MAG: thioredoxin-dependent thiol peroxidase [Salinirussus sp.]